jgi:hypothetical protein
VALRNAVNPAWNIKFKREAVFLTASLFIYFDFLNGVR